IENHSEHFYIRANRSGLLYDCMLALRGWQREEINGNEYELNSIITEKREGKAIVRWRGKLQNVVYITICCGF
ncbi:MAG: hypothetical protein II750_02690, partial [Bacteroidaceae bacterium]|nr:hypothetical protein [Bacteroidaceae bacterium]